jgi:histidine triad (HIT) family protein
MTDCILCKIASKQWPSAIVWEGNDYVAIVDKYPVVMGQILIVAKKHLDSKVFNLSDDQLQNLVLACKQVARKMVDAYRAERVLLRVEGLEIPHLHAKLLPAYTGKKFITKRSELTTEQMAKVLAKFNPLERGEE